MYLPRIRPGPIVPLKKSLRKPRSTFIDVIGETGKGDPEALEIVSHLAVEVHEAGDIVRDAIMLQGIEVPAWSSGVERVYS
ncbi:hypothetical protein [Methanosarcina sp.]|uniref:hypothetical protein n=1 Tax=Methanosarcina sp. TaxID=2213 RepID=UPI003C736114